MKSFLKDEGGAAAIEFAFTAPILIFVALGGIAIGMALWQWNSLQSAAKLTARCAALQSFACAEVPAGCTADDAGVCYAVDQVRAITFNGGISESDVAIDRGDSVNGVSVTTVSINEPFELLSSSFTLKAKASFPNSGGGVASTSAAPVAAD